MIVNPDLYEKYRVVINREKFLRVEGVLQNQDHTISIKASRVLPISITAAETQSHDFHQLRRLLPVSPLFRHDQSGPYGHYRDYVGSLPPILLVAYCSF